MFAKVKEKNKMDKLILNYQFLKKPEYTFTMHISYLEIYNENGYDLLDPQHQVSKLEDLP